MRALLIALAWGWVALAAIGPVAAAPVEPPTATGILADDAFGFCHDPRYPLTADEAQWCAVLPAPNPRCPALRSACRAPRAELEGGLGPLSRRTAASDGGDDEAQTPKTKAPAPTRGPTDHRRRVERNDPVIESGALGPLPQVMVWLIVLGMLVAVVAQLRTPRARARPRPGPGPKDGAAVDEPVVDQLEGPTPRLEDVEGLLARAEHHARQGRLDAAVADGHAALIRRLAERGRIRLHPSRTNGDHVRDLRDDAPLYEPARQVMRVVERVQFGHAPVTREEAAALLGRVRAMLGALAGVLLLGLTTLACSPTPERDYPWSHSPSGMAGVLSMMRGHGLEVEYRVQSLEVLRPTEATPVVLDGVELGDQEWSALLRHVEGGGRVVLATREPLPASLGIGWAKRQPGALTSTMTDRGLERTVIVPGTEGLVARDDALVLLAGPGGTAYGLRLAHGDGELVVLADSHLLTNAGLAVADNGAWLVEMLTSTETRLQLVDGGVRSMSGEGASDPFDAISRGHLTPVVLQGLLLVLLLYLWRGVHFGRPRDPPPRSRRRFTEHVQALADHYARAEARRHALRLYAGWALERIHERFGGPRGGLEPLAHRIATRTGGDQTEIIRLLVEAQHARDEDPSHDPRGDAEDLRIIRELGQLLEATAGR